jgi:deoxyribonuclease V
MDYLKLHPWNIGYKRAAALQEELRSRLSLTPLRNKPHLIAGADASYHKRGDLFFGAVVVFSLKAWKIVEFAVSWGRVSFPYVPGLLSFREAPILLKAFRKIRSSPDLVIFDSQGIAHPRGFGLAAHMGLLLDVPSIGCAKSRLIGEYREPGRRAGCRSALTFNGARIGTVVRSRDGVKPVFISPGHRMDHREAVRWVLKCCRGYRLPEPTRQAHILVNTARRERMRKNDQHRTITAA